MAQDRQAPARASFLDRVRGYLGNLSLAFAGIGVTALLGAGITYLLASEDLTKPALVLMGLGLSFLLLFGFSAFNQIIATVTGRRGRYGIFALLMSLAFIGVVAAVNFGGARNSARYDTTATKQFTLSIQTRNILRGLDQKVEAVGFFDPGHPSHQPLEGITRDLMSEYTRHSDNFTYEQVDPFAKPSLARRYNVTTVPVVVIVSPETGRLTQIFGPSEQNFTTSILMVTGKKQKQIYFLTGHGERDPGDLTDRSLNLGLARQGLLADNYRVDTLLLHVNRRDVPEDTAVLVVAGPTTDLAEVETEVEVDGETKVEIWSERESLLTYLKGGGKALFLLEPSPPEGFKLLLEQFGIGVAEGTVVDPFSSLTGDKRTPIVDSKDQFSSDHLITHSLNGTLFAQATEVHKTFEKDENFISVEPLIITSSLAWQETDPVEDSLDEEDKIGPLMLALAVEATAPLGEEEPAEALTQAKLNNPGEFTQLVVLGDADFASNRFFSYRSNGDLFLNSVNWLARDVNLIAIRPKVRVFRQLAVNQREWDFIRFSSWLLLPFAVTLVGGFVWWRRR